MVAFFWTPIACVVAGLLAGLSTAWSRFSSASGWVAWPVSVCAALAILACLPSGRGAIESAGAGDWLGFANSAVPLSLTLVVPQLLAYPLTRERPNWRPAVAIVLVVAGAALWAGGGMAVGATGD
jgi:drug/metabolite transporter (DMT)-like permease